LVEEFLEKSPFMLGELRVEPASLRVVWPNGREEFLQLRIMHLLTMLVENAGQCVSREALIERVWEGRFVDEQVLTRAVSDLRKALGDSPKSPRYVATVPKRGYRLLAAMTRLEAEVAATDAPEGKRRRLWKWGLWLAGVSVLLVLAWVYPVARETPSSEPAVNAAFYKGRYFLKKGTPNDLYRAQTNFEKALELDPKHLGARKGLAESWLRAPMPGWEKAVKVRALLEPALTWAPQDAELNYLLGDLALYYERDAKRAEKFLNAALRYAPENAAFLHGMGSFLLATGEGELARRYLDEALGANPVSTLIRCDLSWTLLFAGDLAAAFEFSIETLNLEPENPHAHACLLQVYRLRNRLDLARREALWLMTNAGAPYDALAQVENASPEKAMTFYDHWHLTILDDYRKDHFLDPLTMARAYVRTAQFEEALTVMEAAEQQRSPHLIFLGQDPRFQPLCGMERFQKILNRTRLTK